MVHTPKPEQAIRPKYNEKNFPLLCRLFGHREIPDKGLKIFQIDETWFKPLYCDRCNSFFVKKTILPPPPPKPSFREIQCWYLNLPKEERRLADLGKINPPWEI